MGFVRFTKRLISIAVVPSIVFWALVTVFSPVKVERDWMELVAKLPTKSAFVMVTEESRLDDVKVTIQYIQDNFNRFFNYPILILSNTQFSKEFKLKVRIFARSRVTFDIIDQSLWGYPSEKLRDTWKPRMEDFGKQFKYSILHADSESFRHMSRFWAFKFMHHRLIRNLDYVWRLEAGSKLTCVIEKDIFAEFQEKNLKYGFAMAMKEFHETVTDFWELTTKPDLIRNDDKSYNLCHFWTNFEIMHIPSFQSISYKEFSDFVDATGLIYTSRLSDGPIRTIGVMRNFKTNEIAHLSDFGYIHTSHSFCPVLDRCYCKDGSMNECTDAFSKEFVKYSNE